MDVQKLLDNVEEVVACHVVDRFAARDRHDLALHFKNGLAILERDVEAITRKREDLFAQNQRLALAGDELVPNADWLWCRRELESHDDVSVCAWGEESQVVFEAGRVQDEKRKLVRGRCDLSPCDVG